MTAEHKVSIDDVELLLDGAHYSRPARPGGPAYVKADFVKREDEPVLFATLNTLCRRTRRAMPEVVSYEGSSALPNIEIQPIRERPVVLIEKSVLPLLNDKEMYAVLAHEFSHKLNGPDLLLKWTVDHPNVAGAGVTGVTAGLFFSPQAIDRVKGTAAEKRTRRDFLKIGAAVGAGTALRFPAMTPLNDMLHAEIEADADAGAIALGAEKEAFISALRKIQQARLIRMEALGMGSPDHFAGQMQTLEQRFQRIRNIPERSQDGRRLT